MSAEHESGATHKVSVIGLGKLGAPLAAVMAKKGFETIGLDLNTKFVDAINSGKAPVAEPRLQECIDQSQGLLRATSHYRDAVLNSDVSFVVVPTPSAADGFFTNQYVLDAIEAVGAALRDKNGYHLVVITSTVMPGSIQGEIRASLERASGRRMGDTIGLCYNPEFIALGSVIRDLLQPDFILIGESDERAGEMLAAIYRTFCDNSPPIHRMNFVNAEICKISINTYVTTKISYANMLAEMCDRLPGADVDIVSHTVGADTRIGNKYFKGAIGYGGPCFPRDNKAFSALGRRLGVRCDLAEVTDKINDYQLTRLLDAVRTHAASGARVAVLGLSYKPDTHVIEESQGVILAARLSAEGYVVSVYDPVAMLSAQVILGDRVIYADSVDRALEKASLAVIATPWAQFKNNNISAGRLPEDRLVIIDPWHLLDGETLSGNVVVVRMGYGGAAQKPAKLASRPRLLA